jgi:L-threonylcarbamoyladenylate synthase
LVTDEQIGRAARIIREGGLVAFPTETVYGLGADAGNAAAVAQIFELKGRPRFDPLIVHVADQAGLEELVESIPDRAAELIERFWPGPLSLVLPKRASVPEIVTAGLPSVAVRCPSHPVARALIDAAGVALAAPSANRFGAVSPTTAQHVADQFGNSGLSILDGGPCQVGVESTVVSFIDPTPRLLRPGGITFEEIEQVIGVIEVGQTNDVRPESPGQLSRHYSPSTPFYLSDSMQVDPPRGRVGLLSLTPPISPTGFAVVEVLSATGDLREAAANLFAAMRRMDSMGLDCIVAQPLPEVGLGRAIMDRLRRAAARGK